MFEDPIVDETRKNRETIAAGYNYDIHKLFVHWRALEEKHPARVVTIAPDSRQLLPIDHEDKR